jgi:hypothetical protein
MSQTEAAHELEMSEANIKTEQLSVDCAEDFI